MKESFTPKRFLAFSLFMLVSLCGAAGLTRAQSLTGQITGIVQDEKGAVIPNANIELRNEASGDVRRTVSNDEGYFTFASVLAANYTINIEAAGFAKYSQTGIVFNVGDKITIRDISLKAGGVGEQVTVVASQNEIVPVDTGEKAALISAEQIQNISVVGRSAAELIKVLPGFIPTATGLNNQVANTGEVMGINGNGDAGKQSAIGNYSANGGRTDQIDIVSDGAHVSDPGCNCATPVNPNTDMVQEFKVLQSNFGAENSKGPVVINTVSKSGGNEFHGTGYVYARNYKLNANEWGLNKTGVDRPKNKFWFPGGNLGGPVLIPGTGFNKNRDKLFFFTGYEYYYQKLDTGLLRSIVPTEAMRNGNFTDTAYLKSLEVSGGTVSPTVCNPGEGGALPTYCSGPGQLASSQFDPGGRVLLGLLPLPNIDPSANNGFNYAQVVEFKQPSTQFLTRVDYSISDNTKLFVRYNRQRETQPFPVGLWWRNSGQVPYPTPVIGKNLSDSYSATLTNVLNPTMTNEIIFGHTIIKFPNVFEDPTKVSRSALNYPYKGLFQNGIDQIPSFTGWSNQGAVYNPGGFFDPGGDRGLFADKYLTSIGDNLTKVAGTHTLKFGFYFENVINNQPGNGNSNQQLVFTPWDNPNSTGNAFADMVLGRVQSVNEQTPNVLFNIAYQTYEGYASDSWKATPKLTLEYGLRLARLGNWYDREGNGFAVFDASKYDPSLPLSQHPGVSWHAIDSSVPIAGQKQKALQLMPRFGFAYDLRGNGRTVLRGGYGQFTFHEAQQTAGLATAAGVQSISYSATQHNAAFGAPLTLAAIDALAGSLAADIPSDVSAFDPNDTRKPITHSYSFTIQQKLPLQMTAEVSYVGNKTNNLLNDGHQNINVIPFGTLETGDNPANFRPFRTYNAINLISHTSYQNYNSLQALISRQTGRIGYMMSYTFSKTLGIRGGAQGDTVDNLDIRGHNYGVLSYDRTHVFNIAYNIYLPNFAQNYMGGNGFARAVLDGWQASGITQFSSGYPLQLAFSNFQISGTNADGDDVGSPIAFTGTPDTKVQPTLLCDPRKGTNGGLYANPDCFGAPLKGQNGAYIFPYLKGPAFQNHDLSLFKNFNFSETKKLQFRVSAYNFLNHPLESLQNSNLDLTFDRGVLTEESRRNFGRVTDLKFGRRVLQLALKFYF